MLPFLLACTGIFGDRQGVVRSLVPLTGTHWHYSDALSSLRALRQSLLPALPGACEAVIVLGAGTDSVNGWYTPAGMYGGRQQYRKGSTEIYHARGGDPWWFMGTYNPALQRSTVIYAAYAMGSTPPELGWASTAFSPSYVGDASRPPLVVPVRRWFAQHCGGPLAPRFHVFTIGTSVAKSMQQAASCKRSGLDLHMLPVPWPNYVVGKIKNGQCATAMLASRPDNVVVFADGYDAAWMCSERQLETELDRVREPILIGGEQSWWCPGCTSDIKSAFERTFWPGFTTLKRYAGGAGKYQYLNSGAIVARAWALREACTWFERNGWRMVGGDRRPDDQSAWYEYAIAHPGRVHVDFEQRVMSNVHSTHELNLNVRRLPDSRHAVQCEISRRADGRLVNDCTGKTTCGIHAAGSCNGNGTWYHAYL